jgi:hypothetical protein
VLRGSGAVEREERKGGVREMQEVVLALYRAEREGGRARRRWSGSSPDAPLMAAAARWRAVVGRFRRRGRGEAAVGEWGGALMAHWRRRTGAGRPGRRGRPAAARPLEGERRRWRLGTGPTGGPRLSVRERERGRGAGRGRRWARDTWARWVGLGFFLFFLFLFQIDFKPIFPTIFKSNLFHILTQIYPTILRLLENLLNNFSNIFKFKLSFFLIQTLTPIFTIIFKDFFTKKIFKTFRITPQTKLMHFNMMHKHLGDSNY